MSAWSDWNEEPAEAEDGQAGEKEAGNGRRTAITVATVAAAIAAVGFALGFAVVKDTGAGSGRATETEAAEPAAGTAYADCDETVLDSGGVKVRITGTGFDGMRTWVRAAVENASEDQVAVSLTQLKSSSGAYSLQGGRVFAEAGGTAEGEIALSGGDGTDALPVSGAVTVQESHDMKYAGSVYEEREFKTGR